MQLDKTNLTKIKECIYAYTPTKMQIVLIGVYLYTTILLRLSQVFNIMLGLMIKHMPDVLFPSTNSPIKIINAIDERGVNIAKKLEAFIYYKWDKTMCDDQGGIDLDKFSEWIGSSVIWVAYIMDYDIKPADCENFLQFIKTAGSSSTNSPKSTDSNTDGDIKLHSIDHFKKIIRVIVINTSKKIVYKINKATETLEAEDMLFGEVDFS